MAVFTGRRHGRFIGSSAAYPGQPPPTLGAFVGGAETFAMALQGVLLSLLMTFARAPWYGYEQFAPTASPWGLDPLADQQLAGMVMWIPVAWCTSPRVSSCS